MSPILDRLTIQGKNVFTHNLIIKSNAIFIMNLISGFYFTFFHNQNNNVEQYNNINVAMSENESSATMMMMLGR